MKRILFFVVSALMLTGSAVAQRIAQPLGRGVVATSRNGQGLISWRRLAQDPEGACYNVYVNGQKVNAQPLAASCLQRTMTNGDHVAVSVVDKKGVEGPKSTDYIYRTPVLNNVFMKIDFAAAGSPLPNDGSYVTKFCWPVDLTGDGEYDYVVDRIHVGSVFTNRSSSATDCVEAYSHDGKHLWTVQLGPNIFLSKGQNDGVTVGDFDCDGYGDVMMQASDSCRLWNSATRTWGKWLVTAQNDGSTPDADGDGQINYTSGTRNPQYYMLVVDGRTGAQKDCVPQTLPKDNKIAYTRTNKTAWMGDEYSYPSAAMGTAYLDGIHPSGVAQFQVRATSGEHHYFTYAYGYDFAGGAKPVFKELFTFAFHDNGNPSEFHHLRQGDVDEDGKDETINGAFALDHDGKVLWNSGIGHGDRFRMSDIDPERPGQEIYAIQQNVPDMLGQLLYSATDGKSIKRWYLNAVGDTGRGECMDVLRERKGYEMWSTMPNMYDCKGKVAIEGSHSAGSFPYPTEGLWWDGELDREAVNAPDSKVNLDIRKFNYTSAGQRLIEMGKESNYTSKGESGIRAMFWGDIVGDWREEVVMKVVSGDVQIGIIGYTTNIATSVNNIYCLQQDPGYRGQCTNRGYYQTPNTSFYLGFDMPRPALPPFVAAQRTWRMDESVWEPSEHTSILFGLGGNPNVTLKTPLYTEMLCDSVFVMTPKGHDYTFECGGIMLNGEALWKSGAGQSTFKDGNFKFTDSVYVSEGTLRLDGGYIYSPVSLRARGTLAGKFTLKHPLVLEGALHYEGCRLLPDPEITVMGDLQVTRLLYVQVDAPSENASLKVSGKVLVSDSLCFSVPEDLAVGSYVMLEAGDLSALNLAKIGLHGNALMQYEWQLKENQLLLVVKGYTVKEPRVLADNVVWSGQEDGTTWNRTIENWKLADGGAVTNFVNGDHVLFENTSNGTSIKLDETVTVSGLEVSNSYALPIVGNGAIAGPGALIKKGSGQLSLSTSGKNSWSGGTYLQNGTLAQGQYTTIFGRYGDTIHVTKGTMQMFYTTSSGNAPTFDYVYHLPEADNQLTIIESGRGSLKGKVIGNGCLVLYNNYVRADNYLDLSEFEGVVSLDGPSDYREHRFVNSTVNMKKARLELPAGMKAQGYKAGGSTAQANVWNVGSLEGTGLLGTGTWNVGYDNSDFTYACTNTAAPTFHKYGAGVMQMTLGSVLAPVVHEGTLYVYNTITQAQPCTGLITIENGGTLQCGTCSVGSVRIRKGGILQVANLSGGIAKIRARMDQLTIESGATIDMRYCPGGYDVLLVNASGSITDPHFLFRTPANQTTGKKHEWAVGDEMQLLQKADGATLTVSGTVTIEHAEGAELPEGLYWDTTTLAEDGTIRLRSMYDGLVKVWYDAEGKALVYDLHGRLVQNPLSGQLYLISGKKVHF